MKKRCLNIDKVKQNIENLERIIIPELQEIDESLLKEISEFQNHFELFEVSVKKIQMCARDETEEAFTDSSSDDENESLDQYIVSISTYFEI